MERPACVLSCVKISKANKAIKAGALQVKSYFINLLHIFNLKITCNHWSFKCQKVFMERSTCVLSCVKISKAKKAVKVGALQVKVRNFDKNFSKYQFSKFSYFLSWTCSMSHTKHVCQVSRPSKAKIKGALQ